MIPVVSELTLLVSTSFRREALYVYIDDSRSKRVPVDDAMMRRAGIILDDVVLTEPESESYVEHAAYVDDGEAQALAIAQHRSLSLLSDDRAGIRRARDLGIDVVTTLDLLVAWSDGRQPEIVARAAVSLRLRGRYAPPREHPHTRWFRELLDESLRPS